MTLHRYDAALTWTGATTDYRSYSRTHEITANGVAMQWSADRAFRGDPALPNPEVLLVAAASSCQFLSFLAVAARAGVDVAGYHDDASGEMDDAEQPTSITRIVLHPRIAVRGDVAPERVQELIEQAHEQCYIASSLRAEIVIEPTIEAV